MGFIEGIILNLFGIIDWMLTLPLELDREFWQEYREYEESQNMRYITSVERIGIEEGRKQGIEQGIEQRYRAES